MNDIQTIEKIDALYISDGFFQRINRQSCDCDEIVIKCSEQYFALTNRSSEENPSVDVRPIGIFEKERYPIQVDLQNRVFGFDRVLLNGQGAIDGIRFKSDDVFLFVFSLAYNLVLTMSKYDLFEELETEIQAEEAFLRVIKTA